MQDIRSACSHDSDLGGDLLRQLTYMKHIFSAVMLLALLVTGASAQLKPRGTQQQRDKLIRDYNTIGHADTMAVIYDASCLNGDNNKRAQCYTEDMAALARQ